MTVHELRKEGRLKEAWQKAQAQFSENHYKGLELAWVYYDFLKREVGNNNINNFFKVCDKLSEITFLQKDKMIKEQLSWTFFSMLKLLSSNPNRNSEKVQNLIGYYTHIIGFTSPSLPQSLFIKSLLKYKITIPHFWKLPVWFEPELLREEDFLPEEFNNKKIMPLAERVFYAYAKALIDDAKNELEEAVLHLVKFINLCQSDKKKQGYKFFDYYLAESYILSKDYEAAFKYASSFIQRNHLKSWAWSLLSKACNNKVKQIVFLAKAISLEKNEAYLLPVRAALNEHLIQTGQLRAASQNSQKMIQLRTKNGWPIPAKLNELKASDWYFNPPAGDDLDTIISREASKALKTVFTGLIEEKAVVISDERKNAKLFTAQGETYKYKTMAKLPAGDWLQISRVKNKILGHIKTKMPERLNGKILNFSGNLIVKSNYGFVNKVFVSPKLIEKEGIKDQNRCSGLAVLVTNPKTERKGWRAVTLNEGLKPQ